MDRVAALAIVIREARQSRGISQEKLAELAGIHRNFVGMIERNLSAPTAETIFAIADALEVRASELLRLAEERDHVAQRVEQAPRSGTT